MSLPATEGEPLARDTARGESARGRGAWHAMTPVDAFTDLESSPDGLSTAEGARRLEAHGANVVEIGRRHGDLAVLAAQFTDLMILLLLAAAAISAALGEIRDSLAIVAIVVINAVVGFLQERRAERAMEALRDMAAPSARVVRDGRASTIPAAQLVPGDVVLLEAGAGVPADLRLVERAALRTDESLLTGESVPVDKHTQTLAPEHAAVGDRRNMAFKGTLVTSGRGRGVVVATAGGTEFGRVAASLEQATGVRPPRQRRLAAAGRNLAATAGAVCAVVFAAGLLRGEPPVLVFLTAVSLAVAAIPEALPAVVTVSLALGARRMARHNALIRRLPAVEALGSVTVICADKTGTLTLNQMTVEAYCRSGERSAAPGRGRGWDELLRAMALCNDAEPGCGEPTELALLSAATEAGLDRGAALADRPRVAEVPFDAARRCMTTIHRDPEGGFVSYTKGAPETVLAASWTAVGEDLFDRARLQAQAVAMAADGLRVLAFATRRWEQAPRPQSAVVEVGLTFLGFVGLMDPPRPQAAAAVATCRAAGITPVMITGDHPATARAVARRLGLLDAGGALLTGDELSALSDEQLEQRCGEVRVYARVAPEQKLRIVRALQRRGELVAMTGDGVNDAPALRQAEVGVAMGKAGTDVAREASALVLLDDDFATIVRAVAEGRRIYDNVRRFVRYAVTTNSAELWTIALAPFLGMPVPLLPLQILWMNLVTDSLPGLALAAEPPERNLMRRPPRPPAEGVFGRGLGTHVAWVGALMAAVTLAVLALALATGTPHWRTIVFNVLCISQLANVLAIRSETESLFSQGVFSNRPLAATVLITLALQAAATYHPALAAVLHTDPLTLVEVALTLLAASVVFVAVEVEKALRRHGTYVRTMA